MEFKDHVIGWADLVSNIELKESFGRRILNLVSAQIRTSQEKKPYPSKAIPIIQIETGLNHC